MERASYEYPIGTDNTSAMHLPLQQHLAAHRAAVSASDKCRVVVDNGLEFTFLDTLTIPPPEGASVLAKPQTVQLRVSWGYATIVDAKLAQTVIVSKVTMQLESPDL